MHFETAENWYQFRSVAMLNRDIHFKQKDDDAIYCGFALLAQINKQVVNHSKKHGSGQ